MALSYLGRIVFCIIILNTLERKKNKSILPERVLRELKIFRQYNVNRTSMIRKRESKRKMHSSSSVIEKRINPLTLM